MPNDEQATPIIKIGSIDISESIIGIKTNAALSEEGTATLTVDATHSSLVGVDYADEVTVSAALGDSVHRIFTGDVARVAIGGGGQAVIECANMTAFRELAVGHLEVKNCGAPDIVYALAKSVGLDDSRIDIRGYADPDPEDFEVVAPLIGILLEGEARVGEVALRPAALGIPASCQQFDLSSDANDFAQAEAFAVVSTRQCKLYDAQKTGLESIDDAISWLTVRSRYSSSVGPAGHLIDWYRGQMRFSPRRGRLVSVHGRETRRAWLRSAVDIPILSPLGILENAPSRPVADPGLVLAFASCRRAATSERFVERVAVIWESIEYFVGSQKAPRMFTSDAIAEIRRLVETVDLSDCDDQSRNRLDNLVGDLNSPPLMVRFHAKLKENDISVRKEDLEVLTRLRKVRNRASHGKEAVDPGRETVDRGVAVLSRILVTMAYKQEEP